MAQKLTVVGKLSAGLEDGGTVAPLDLGVNYTYLNRADFERDYAGAVTDDVVNLGTLAALGAKGVFVKCMSGSCVIKFNGEALAIPLAPGGFFLWVNPSTPFIDAALITTVGAAHVIFFAVL